MASSNNSSKKASSSFDAFAQVDALVSKPVVGSDGAASWQSFQQTQKTNRSSVAPTAPLKKADRASGISSWQQEREVERDVRKQSNHAAMGSGYTVFQEKPQQDALTKKQKQRILKRIRPDDKDYFIASKTFQGHKHDYVFTTRDERGTGYYWDGMDSVKQLESGQDGKDASDAPPTSSEAASKTTATTTNDDTSNDADPVERKKKKRKKAKEGPVIVDTPNNPLQQVAALLQQRQQQQNASLDGLPAGWEAATDKATNKTYYYNRTTGKRTWEKPANDALPSGWSAATDPSSGKEYFYHAATGETKWERPTE